MTQQDLVIQELRTLPTEKQTEVLDFIRFIKIRLKRDEQVQREFRDAIARARAIAAERGITEADIAKEIRRFRAEQ
jgi:hypothetical protein